MLAKQDERFFVSKDLLQFFIYTKYEVYHLVFTDHKYGLKAAKEEEEEEEEILRYGSDTRLHDNPVNILKSKIKKSYRASSRKHSV